MAGAITEGMIDTTTLAVGFAAIVAGVASTIVFAVHRASRSRRVAAVTAAGIASWLTVTALLAGSGALSNFDAAPPRMMIVLAGAMALFAFATTRPIARRLLDAAPKHWPIAIQTMRIPIELVLWGLFAAGKLPVQMTFEGRNFDILVGLTAPLVALAVARGWIGTRGAVVWNFASFGLLLNIMGIAVTTMPGPLHLDWPGVSNVIVTTPPFVWLPAFLVPVAFFGHVLSLRQLWTTMAASWRSGGRRQEMG